MTIWSQSSPLENNATNQIKPSLDVRENDSNVLNEANITNNKTDVNESETISNQTVNVNDEIKLPPENVINQNFNDTSNSTRTREDGAKSLKINVDKYTSPEFHSENNFYEPPSSPSAKKNSEKVQSFTGLDDFQFELTTPKYELFDDKFKKIQQEIEQNFDDANYDVSKEIHSENFDVNGYADKKIENTTIVSVDYKNFKNVLTSDPQETKSINRNVTREKGSKLNVNISYSETKSYGSENGTKNNFKNNNENNETIDLEHNESVVGNVLKLPENSVDGTNVKSEEENKENVDQIIKNSLKSNKVTEKTVGNKESKTKINLKLNKKIGKSEDKAIFVKANQDEDLDNKIETVSHNPVDDEDKFLSTIASTVSNLKRTPIDSISTANIIYSTNPLTSVTEAVGDVSTNPQTYQTTNDLETSLLEVATDTNTDGNEVKKIKETTKATNVNEKEKVATQIIISTTEVLSNNGRNLTADFFSETTTDSSSETTTNTFAELNNPTTDNVYETTKSILDEKETNNVDGVTPELLNITALKFFNKTEVNSRLLSDLLTENVTKPTEVLKNSSTESTTILSELTTTNETDTTTLSYDFYTTEAGVIKSDNFKSNSEDNTTTVTENTGTDLDFLDNNDNVTTSNILDVTTVTTEFENKTEIIQTTEFFSGNYTTETPTDLFTLTANANSDEYERKNASQESQENYTQTTDYGLEDRKKIEVTEFLITTYKPELDYTTISILEQIEKNKEEDNNGTTIAIIISSVGVVCLILLIVLFVSICFLILQTLL